MFYSRRIGLNGGQEVPMDAGGRLTGKVGAFSVGAMYIRTGAEDASATPETGFSVLRVKRDLLRRSSIGAIFTGRSHSTRNPTGSNEVYGIDGTFGFFEAVALNAYWADTRTPGGGPDTSNHRAQFAYNGDRYGLEVERLVVGKDFNPEVGFLPRSAFERSVAMGRFSPRPLSIAAGRKFTWQARLDYVTDREGVLETREADARFGIEFESGDLFDTGYSRTFERLVRPFRIASDVTIPVGAYDFEEVRMSVAFAQHRRFSGRLSAQHGAFFGGEKTSVGFTGGRIQLTSQVSLEPSLSLDRVDLPGGGFRTRLMRLRTTYTVTPLMFVSALVQYNSSSDSLSTNIRFRWEYLPGSELFVVYNEQRDTLVPRAPELENRAFVVKINRLFRF